MPAQGKRRTSQLHPSERLLGLTRRVKVGSLRATRSAEETFRPDISAHARMLPARSASELSDGGRARRERALVRRPLHLHCMRFKQKCFFFCFFFAMLDRAVTEHT